MKSKWFYLLPVAIIGVGGCVKPDPQFDNLNARLEEINTTLTVINEKASSPKAIGDMPVKKTELESNSKLSKIKPLPEQPTPEDVTEYLKAILEAVKGQKTFKHDDEAAQMIRAIGYGHLKQIAPFWSKAEPYFNMTMESLISLQDKSEILELLPEYPHLYMAVTRYGFNDDLDEVRPAVFKALKKDTALPWVLTQAILQYVRDEDDIRYLSECFIENPAAMGLLGQLAYWPGVDTHKLASQAWENQFNLPKKRRLRQAESLIPWGCLDAFEYTLRRYAEDEKLQKRKRDFHKFISPDPGKMSYPELLEFLLKHKDQITYDAKTRKYILSKGE